MNTSPTTESRELPKSFDTQLRAAFEAGRRLEFSQQTSADLPAPTFEEWRPSLGESA